MTTRAKAIVGGAVAFVGVTFSTVAYLATRADAQTVEVHGNRLTAVEVELRYVHDDLKWIRRQVEKVADAVSAEKVPPPHEEKYDGR